MKNKLLSWAHLVVLSPDPLASPTFSPSGIWEESVAWARLISFAMPQDSGFLNPTPRILIGVGQESVLYLSLQRTLMYSTKRPSLHPKNALLCLAFS